MERQNKDGSYVIPASRLDVLRAGVAQLNKRAAKLGMAPVTVTAGAPRSEFVTKSDAYLANELRKVRWVLDVRLTGTVPVIAGFAFVAKLDHLDGGNLVLRAPGYDGDLDGYRVVGSRCQHCGLDRSRAATFLVRDESGNIIQVGRQCLRDYTRTDDVEGAVKLFRCWSEFLKGFSDTEEGGWGFGRWQPESTPLDYLAAAVANIRLRGFHKSGSDERSTRSFCDFICAPCPVDKGFKGDRELIKSWKAMQPTDAQREQAAVVLAWVLASKDSSDYMHNSRLACAERTVRERTEGILASLPVSYDKAMGREQERRERPEAGPHVGTVGERITTKITVKLARGYESEFGTGVMLLMLDAQNSALKTFSSGSLSNVEDFDGEWFLIGTVKKHETDQKYGHPVTLLSRVELRKTEAYQLPKPKKAKPKSKGLPFYGFLPNGTVGIVAVEWKPPVGTVFSWEACQQGIELHKLFARDWRLTHTPWDLPGYQPKTAKAAS
jgi:hypothetical protein